MAEHIHPPLHARSSVLGVVTHYKCEQWLAKAISSLVNQARPLDGIVVVDDGSAEPPIAIVQQFPQVTLLTAVRNVGPYCLIQAVIDRTRYDAYLMQDADDWSTPERVAVLLGEAERGGAELIGSRLVNVAGAAGEKRETPVYHPHDVNAACVKWPGEWFVSWGTALVGRELVMRLGGLATGLRVAGDVEFASRAHHAARVVNARQYCYYRRVRPGALTRDPRTGKYSALRAGIRSRIRARARANAAAVAAGQAPDLAPLCVAERVDLHHLAGPRLQDTNVLATDATA